MVSLYVTHSLAHLHNVSAPTNHCHHQHPHTLICPIAGKSCTAVVINVAGERDHAEESLCSLRFGERMAAVRNCPTVVVDSGAGDVRSLQQALSRAQAELQLMTANGCGGGFVEGSFKSEQKSLAENMRKLSDCEEEVRACLTEAAELRSRGRSTSTVEQKLQGSAAQCAVIQSIVERQQTIKELWALPTPAYKRKHAEMKDLEARVTLALGL